MTVSESLTTASLPDDSCGGYVMQQWNIVIMCYYITLYLPFSNFNLGARNGLDNRLNKDSASRG